ncbi:hypothetical protein K1T71_010434 [Dendrolimus kikuchii]|uniref:Uncharacterized protein n=1 Tax=Dendrolimus kikuchii TaxID=765133 RepID=A0ACC1CRH3_9NEOP|nr:hypothetical protein K1T71_010434 [Dendrolimus kikuchii]
MAMWLILVLVASASLVNGDRDERTPLGNALDKASMKLLHEAYKSSHDKNVVTSPLGIVLLLSMYYEGAGPETKKEISQFLGGADYKKISDSLTDFNRLLSAKDPNLLDIANKIYISDKYSPAATFLPVAEKFMSKIEPLNFKDTAFAAGVMNRWAEERTKGHIQAPVSAKDLSPETVVTLLNVIFFQGQWLVAFNRNKTEEKDFHLSSGKTVKKPTMHLENRFLYAENHELGVKLIELNYNETDFRMIVVLPDEIDGLPKVLAKISTVGLLSDIYKMQFAPVIKIDFPKFEARSSFDLTDLLEKVGVSAIFSESAPGIVKDGAATVSKGFQKAYMKVDEEGSTAAVVTGITVVTLSNLGTEPSPMYIKINHPFLYIILQRDKVLFAGTYTH